MMSPNSFAVTSRPRTSTPYWNAWFGGDGYWPTWPAGACTFCSRIALATSDVVMPSSAMRSGLSQMRMPKSLPNACTSPTPSTRLIASTRLMFM